MAKQVEDLIGKKFGRLVVIEKIKKEKTDKETKWLCVCDCGEHTIVNNSNLRNGHTKSCGCLNRDALRLAKTTHGMTHTRLFNIWSMMKKRTSEKSDECHRKYYYEKGITVCDEWRNDFMCFYNWAMENGYDESLTLDRIDVNGNYCPENCRFVSMKIQSNNKTDNRYITFNGETKTVSEVADETGLPYWKVYRRVVSGIDIGSLGIQGIMRGNGFLFNGIVYANVKDACKALGINYNTAYNRKNYYKISIEESIELLLKAKEGSKEAKTQEQQVETL